MVLSSTLQILSLYISGWPLFTRQDLFVGEHLNFYTFYCLFCLDSSQAISWQYFSPVCTDNVPFLAHQPDPLNTVLQYNIQAAEALVQVREEQA